MPDVWIADSSLWLERVRAADEGLVPAAAPSIATSPIVVAVAKEFAEPTGWSRTAPSWSRVRDTIGSGTVTRPGIVNPVVDASGLATLRAMEPEPGEFAASKRHGLIKALSSGHTEIRDELLTKLGPHPLIDRPLADLAILPEYAVTGYNAEGPSKRLTVVLPTPSTALDYPYAVLPTTTGYKATAAVRFGESLAGTEFAKTLQDSGFRPPTRAAASTLSAVDTLVASWLAVVRPLRVLSIVDVSDASAKTVPDTGGASRLKVASAALADAAAIMGDGCWFGVWTSSAGRYRNLMPIRPLPDMQPDVQIALASLAPDKDSRSALADAILAGYKDVRGSWRSGSRNMVLVLAAGNGTDLAEVDGQLRRLKDPNRPVDVAVIALGPGLHSTTEIRVYPAMANGSEVSEGILQAMSDT